MCVCLRVYVCVSEREIKCACVREGGSAALLHQKINAIKPEPPLQACVCMCVFARVCVCV